MALETFDIRDRVNFAVESSILSVEAAHRTPTLERAAEFLDCQLRLVINDNELL